MKKTYGKKLLGDEQAMTIERARVVSVQRGDVTEYSTVWVEAFQRSTHSCLASFKSIASVRIPSSCSYCAVHASRAST